MRRDGIERRPVGWERRATIAGTPSRPIIRGYAIVFNERSVDLGGFVEIIRPEAIRRTFREGIDLRAFIDHDPAKVLGRLSAGTLRATPDDHGLLVEIDPPNRTDARDVIESITRGDVSGMSFSFRTMPDGDEWKHEGKQIVRYVTDMRVFEVSVVSMPAYEQTDVEMALRGLEAYRATAAPTIAQLRARMEQKAAGWR